MQLEQRLGLLLLLAAVAAPTGVRAGCKVKVSASSVQNAVAVAPHQSRTYSPALAPVYVPASSAVRPQGSQPPPEGLIYPDVAGTTQRPIRKKTRGVPHAPPAQAAPPKTGPVYVEPSAAPPPPPPVAPVYAPQAVINTYSPPAPKKVVYTPPKPAYVAPVQAGPVYVPAPPGVVAAESNPLKNKARRKIPSRQVTPISYSTDLSTASDATGYTVDLKTATTSGIPAAELDLKHSATGGHGGGGGGGGHGGGGGGGHGGGGGGGHGGGGGGGGGHGGGGGGGKNFKEGGGKKGFSEHHNSGGKKGAKGYKGHHTTEKGEKGKHDKESKSGEHGEHGGHKKGYSEEGGHGSKYEGGSKGEKGSAFGEDGKHSKGHSTKGEHNIYHKDEYEKKHEFFDESYDGGHHDKHGHYGEHHSDKKGGHEKGGHKKGGHHEDKYGKKGTYGKGHHDEHHKGGENKHGHDEYHDHHESYGKKGGDEGKEEHAHASSDGGGGGHGGGGGGGGHGGGGGGHGGGGGGHGGGGGGHH